MTEQTKVDLLTNISNDLADNNAGAISAADVRENMKDIVDSIISITASGMSEATPFQQNIKLQYNPDTQQGGILRCSGIEFDSGGTQTSAVDPANIDHGVLQGLDDDDHNQYLLATGLRVLSGDFGTDDNWINSSGQAYPVNVGSRGISFENVSNSQEVLHIGTGTSIAFDVDESTMSSANGVAKAWINFDSSTGAVDVNDAYNISGIQRTAAGKFAITFAPGTFDNDNYIAIGTSNGRSTNTNAEDFAEVQISTAYRINSDDGNTRVVYFAVYDRANNNYVDAISNELVVFGRNIGSTDLSSTVDVIE